MISTFGIQETMKRTRFIDRFDVLLLDIGNTIDRGESDEHET